MENSDRASDLDQASGRSHPVSTEAVPGAPGPSVAGDGPARPLGAGMERGDPWDRFLRPADSAAFLSGWIEIAVGRIAGALGGILFLRGEANQFGIACRTGLDPDMHKAVQAFAEKLAQKPKALVEFVAGTGRALAGYPIENGGQLQAVLVVLVDAYDPRRIRELMRDMHWACGWIDAQLWRGKSSLRQRQVAASRLALDLMAAADEHERFEGAALALVNALPEFTGFDRAALGMVKNGRVRLEALSRTAVFKRRADFVSRLEAAMDEAVAQDDAIVLPPLAGARAHIDLAHRTLAEQAGSGAIITAPLIVRGQAVGALLLERPRAADELVSVDPDAVEELRLAAAAVAPVLLLKHRERRWISGRGRDLARRGLTAVFGRRPAFAAGALALFLVGAAALVIQVPLRIQGDATLEGKQQRAAVALVDGFISEAGVRAGDRVKAGDMLARLDDRELRLELNRNEAAVSQALQAVRTALSNSDRAAAAEAQAGLAEAEASLDLTRTRLSQLDIVAPTDGIVVAGDLSQRLGAPVSRGEVLFEIARLDDWRVVIDVSEYDLAPIQAGQTGSVVLNALPGRPLGIVVSTVSSVSQPRNSENRFLIEAEVSDIPAPARPGMEGVARIETGHAPLAWTWLRGTVHRLQLFFWKWMP